MQDLFSLEGRTALITAGARGIGRMSDMNRDARDHGDVCALVRMRGGPVTSGRRPDGR